MNLQTQVTQLKIQLEQEKHDNKLLQEDARKRRDIIDKYMWLREQELMLMTPDGVKYLKGEDLDAYIKSQTMVSLSDSMLADMTERFSRALSAGMGKARLMDAADAYTYTTHGRQLFYSIEQDGKVWHTNGNDAGEKSQE